MSTFALVEPTLSTGDGAPFVDRSRARNPEGQGWALLCFDHSIGRSVLSGLFPDEPPRLEEARHEPKRS